MPITGNQRAVLTARVGAARVGAVRVGFAPKDTQGLTPGTAGPFYIWRRVYQAVANWVAVKR